MIVGTAGHIDHGKTSLVRALTGVDTDRLPEEKRRGITIELGFAPLQLNGIGTVGVVDVPGHEGFVRTMLAGATGIDVGLLVIAADEGVMPQTREHLAILELLGIRGAAVALTKADLVSDEWLELVRDDVQQSLAATSFADVPIIATSIKSGAGFDDLRSALAAALLRVAPRSLGDVFRMPIDRAFSSRGTGTVVTGTVWSGSIGAASLLRLFPGDRAVRVRGLQNHGAPAQRVLPGERAAIALAGIEIADVHRGGVLVQGDGWSDSTTLHAEVELLAAADRPLRPREWLRFHLGTSEVGVRAVAVGPAIQPGTRGLCRLILDAPVLARGGDRFVLRGSQPAATIGGGIVLDPCPGRRRARPTVGWSANAGERIARLVGAAGVIGVKVSELPVRLGIALGDLGKQVDALSEIDAIDGMLFSRSTLAKTVDLVVTEALRLHHLTPLERTVSRAGLRAGLPVPDAIFEHAVARAVASGRLLLDKGGVAEATWSPQMTAQVDELRNWILGRLLSAGPEPPLLADLALERASSGQTFGQMVRLLEREGLMIQVESGRYYHSEALASCVRTLRAAMVGGVVMTPSELRQVLGMSRRFLIPFLEFCDRRRITERQGEGRVLGPAVGEVIA